jgi:protein gp37
MGKTTEIQWADATFNAIRGCSKISPGCSGCYAETHEARFGQVKWGPKGTRLITSDNYWRQPLKWNREHTERQQEIWENHGPTLQRPRVFCASLSDIFEDWKGPIRNGKGHQLFWSHSRKPYESAYHWIAEPDCAGGETPVTMNDVRARLFDLIDKTPHLNWLLLTKRPENILSMWGDMPRGFPHKHRPNCWLGTSVEKQEYANQRIPQLLQCRELAPVLFLSVEPLLGPIDLTRIVLKKSDAPERGKPDVSINCLRGWYGTPSDDRAKIDWVIVGGESGPNARPMHVDWARSIRDQCAGAGVPMLFKQWGEWLPVCHQERSVEFPRVVADGANGCPKGGWPESHVHRWGYFTENYKVGKKNSGRLLDGQLHDGFPKG